MAPAGDRKATTPRRPDVERRVSGQERHTGTLRGRIYAALTAVTVLAAAPIILIADRPKEVWVAVGWVSVILLANLWLVDRLMRPIYDLKHRLQVKNYGTEGARRLIRQESDQLMDIDRGLDLAALLRMITPSSPNVDINRPLPAELGRIERLARAGPVAELAMESVKREIYRHVSHQLKSPLTSIRSHALRVKHAILEGRAEHEIAGLSEIEALSLSMSSLIEQILAMSYVSSLEEKGLGDHCANLSSAVVDALRPRRAMPAAKAFTIEAEVAAGIWVRGYSVLLQELVGALVDNSLRYATGGGLLHVALSIVPGARAAVLTVTDQGPGVPESERSKVFDPFYGSIANKDGVPRFGSRIQSTMSGGDAKSHGLGLSLARSIAILHGATISLHSGPGERGLMVRVVIPTVRAPTVEPDAEIDEEAAG